MNSNEPQFVKVASTADFAHTRMKSVTLLVKKVGIFKRPDGSYFALEMVCKHQAADLTRGQLDGDKVTCPRHGWQYDLNTGRCLNNDSLPLRRHALRLEGDDILVSLSPVTNVPPGQSGY